MRSTIVLTYLVAVLSAVPANTQRIAGGSFTTIDNYPSMAAFSYTDDLVTYTHDCGGAILNNRAVLTAAHCLVGDNIRRSLVRLGSTFVSSGGVTYKLSRVIYNPNWGTGIFESDIAVVHTDRAIVFSNVIQPGRFAGANYIVADNQAVWAAGWGRTGPNVGDTISQQLKHVQLWTFNRNSCMNIYSSAIVNDRVICAIARTDGNGQCSGDSGGPLYHDNVVIGVLSLAGAVCGSNTTPSVSASVSSYISWIEASA